MSGDVSEDDLVSQDPNEHLAWILDELVPLLREAGAANRRDELATEEALGTVLAEDARSAHPLPLWTNSAMDGYAVRSADVRGASPEAPVELRVLGEIAAGSSWDPPLAPGEAVRIMTGAPVPGAADAIVRVERTAGGWADGIVRVVAEVVPGTDLRFSGEDLATGSLVARAGDQLTAPRASALVAAGVSRVRVHPALRVAVIVTGAELQAPSSAASRFGDASVRGMIPESNSLLIRGLLEECGIRAPHIEHCPDDAAVLRARLDALAGSADVIITTGGIGPGTHDVVGAVLDGETEVRTVHLAMRPGKHQRAGRLAGGAGIFALPGNPVSAAVAFELFVRPALRAMQGIMRPLRPRLAARAAVGWRGSAGSLQVLPVRFETVPDRPEPRAADRGDGPSDDALSFGAGLLSFDSDALSGGGGELRCTPAVHARRVSHSVGGFGAAEGYALVGAGRGDIAFGELVTVIRTSE